MGCDGGQGLKDEPALLPARMGPLQVAIGNREAMVPKAIDVKGPGTPPYGTLPPLRAFDALCVRQKATRFQVRLDLNHLVEIVGLFRPTNRHGEIRARNG